MHVFVEFLYENRDKEIMNNNPFVQYMMVKTNADFVTSIMLKLNDFCFFI